jgi:Ubiquitin 3 binding protein But2 C-terminal domain
MKFTLAALAAILSFTSALPTGNGTNSPPPDQILRPTSLAQYSTWTGAVTHRALTGLIRKDNGQSSDITALITFEFPASSAGLWCEFDFSLGSASPYTLQGTAQFDIFTSSQPASAVDTTSWPSGNLRDHYGARLQAVKPGVADYLEGYATGQRKFPCPAGFVVGAELVGVGDVDEWDAATEGPYIRVF